MSEKAPARPPRVYVPELEACRGTAQGKEEILLSKEESAHVRSRRLHDGDEVVALDGKGLRAHARLTRRGTAILLLSFEASSSSPSSRLPGEPANRVTVALACAEPARVEWAVEKGTECGATGFVLLACERSQKAHVMALSSPARLARLRRIAIEATKQCGRTIVPSVVGPESPKDLPGKGRGADVLLIADPSGQPLGPFGGGDAMLAIGPEGGFAPSEILSLGEKGARRTSLGPRILRLETAVVAALTRLVDGG